MACCIMIAFRMEFSTLLPPPKREIGGISISLSMSVPAVLISSSRNAFSMTPCIFRLQLFFRDNRIKIMISLFHHILMPFITSSTSLIPAIKVSMSCFLLRRTGLASIALLMVIRTSLSLQWASWYFFTSMTM